MEKGKEDEGKEDDNIRSLQNYIKLLCSDISGIQTNEKTNENFERLYRYYFLLFIHRIYNYYIIYYINEPIIKKLKEKFKDKELPLIIKINKLKGDISKSTSDKTRFENELEKLDSDRILILKKSESYLKATELANKETEIDNKKKEIDIEDNKIISYKSVINYIENQLRLNNITDAKIKAPTINIDHLNQVIIELDNLSIVYIDIINLIVNQISPPPNDKEYIKNYLNLMNDKVQDQEIQRQRKGFFIYLINNIIYYYITLDNKESDCNEKIWVIFDNRYIKFSEFTMEAPPENMQCTQVTTFIKKLFKEKVDLFDLTNQIIKYEHNYLDICKENKSRVSLTEAEKSKDYIDRKIRFESDLEYVKYVKEAEASVKEAEKDVGKAEKDVKEAEASVKEAEKDVEYINATKSHEDATKSHEDATKSHNEATKSYNEAIISYNKARSDHIKTGKSKDADLMKATRLKSQNLGIEKISAEEIENNARKKLLEAKKSQDEAKKSLNNIKNRINKPLNDAKKKLSTMNETLEKAKKNAIYAYENVGSIYEKAYAAYIIAYDKFDSDRSNVTYQIQLRNTIHEYNRILFGLLSKYIDINFNDKIEKIKLKIKSYITIIKKYLDICKNCKIDITKLNEAEIKLDRLLNNLGGSVKTQMKKAIDLIFSYTDVSLNKSIITVIELDRKIYNIYNDILSTTTELLKKKYEKTKGVPSEKLPYYQIMAPIIEGLDSSLYIEEHYYKQSLSILTKIVGDIGIVVSIDTIRVTCVDLINYETFIGSNDWGIPTIYYNKALYEISEEVNKYNLFLINLKNKNKYKFNIDEYCEKVEEYNKLIEVIKKIEIKATEDRDLAITEKKKVDIISKNLNVKVRSLKVKFIEKITNRIKLLEQKKSDIVARQLGVYEKKDKFKDDDNKFKDESTSFIKERVIEDRYKRNFERFIDQLDRYRGIDEKNKGILPEDTRELNKRLTDYFSKLNNKEYEIDAGKYNKNAEGKYYYNELNLHLDIELKYWVIKNAVNKHKIDEEIKLLRGIREFLNKTIEEQETEILPFINKGDVEGGDIKKKLYIFFKVVNEVEILASRSYDSEKILSSELKDLLQNVENKEKYAERYEKEADLILDKVYYDVLYDVIIDDFIRQGDQISPQTIVEITNTVNTAARVPDQIGDAQRTQDITDTVTTAARVPDQIGDAQRTQDITDTVNTAARVPDQIGDAQRTQQQLQDITDTVNTAARVPDQIGDAQRTQDITNTVNTAARVTDVLLIHDITDTVNTAARVPDQIGDAQRTHDITDTVNTAARVPDQIGDAQRTQQQLQDITDTVTTAARVPDQIGDAQRTHDITDTVNTATRVTDALLTQDITDTVNTATRVTDALLTQDITDTVNTATIVADALRTQDITDTVNTATIVTDALLTQDITDTVNTATRVTDQIGDAQRTQDITDTVNTATRVTDQIGDAQRTLQQLQDITDTVTTATIVADQIGEIAEGTEGEGSKNNEDNKNKKKGNIPFQTPRKYSSINDAVLRGRYFTTGLYKDVTSEDIRLAREYKDDNGSKIIYKQGAIKDMLEKIDKFNYNQNGGDIINEINRFENDINNPIEAFEIRFEDRLVFIIVTFFIRYVAISIIQRGIDSNMVKSFYEGFIYYGGIYILLFWFIVFFVNIDNNYTIDYIDLNNLEIYIRTIFYYFYMGTNGISRLIIHSLLIIIIIIIPIILNTKNRKAKDTLNDDDKDKMELLTLEERTKLSKALSLFTLFIWILTSIIATKF